MGRSDPQSGTLSAAEWQTLKEIRKERINILCVYSLLLKGHSPVRRALAAFPFISMQGLQENFSKCAKL